MLATGPECKVECFRGRRRRARRLNCLTIKRAGAKIAWFSATLVGAQNGARIQRTAVRRLCFFAGVLVVVLAIASVEIPELLTICDDASNDFVVTAASPKLLSLQPLLKGVISATCDKNSGSCLGQPAPAAGPQVLEHTGRNLLVLHSVQKK